MRIELTCHRCGKAEVHDEEQRLNRGDEEWGRVMRVGRTIYPRDIDHIGTKGFDLCPSCSKSFSEWLAQTK